MRSGALALLLALASGNAGAQTIRQDFHITNGTVNAVLPSGNTLYLGGTFTRVGPVTGSGVPVDATTGAIVAGFPQVSGQVNAVVADGAGGWYIGGLFTTVGGLSRTNLARVLADNSVSSWNPGADGQVLALALSGGVLYAGGAFSNAGGQARSRIAAIDAGTGAATTWNPGANDLVRTIVPDGGLVYIGGRFTFTGGATRNRGAALDATTGAANGFNPNASLDVYALAVNGGTVFAGGAFSTIGGAPRPRVAALSAATGTATSWNPGANSQVSAIVTDGTSVFLGGIFTQVGGQPRNRIASVDASTGALNAWDANAGGIVSALALSGGTLYAGGDFLTMGGLGRSRLAAVNPTSAAVLSWDPAAYGAVNALALGGGRAYAGGSFSGMGGFTRNNLAAIDLTSGATTSWNPDVDGGVLAISIDSGLLYAAGTFANVGGQPRANLAAVDLPGGTVTSWNPGTDGQVAAVDAFGGKVYVGGLFTTAGGATRANIAAIDALTGVATSWDPGTDGQVFDLQVNRVDAGILYVGGVFASAGGHPRNNLAAIDLVSGTASAWNPDPNGTIREIAVNCGVVYTSGFFTTIGGQSRSRVAALDAGTGLATSWDPNANGPAFSVRIDNGFVYVGGIFGTIGGQTRNRLAALDATTGLATPWNPNANSTIRAVTTAGGKVYVGGSFGAMGPTLQANVAAMDADNSVACPTINVTPTFFPAGIVGTAFSQSMSASGGNGPYCFAVTEGTLPPGLVLSSSTGAISGTPTTPATSIFSVTATDARGCTGTQSCTIDVFDSSVTARVAADVTGLEVNPAHACVTVPIVWTRSDATPARGFSITFLIDSSRLALCGSPGFSIHIGSLFDAFPNAFLQVTNNGAGSYTVDGSLLGLPCGPTTGGTLFTVDLKSNGPDGAGAITMTSVRLRDCANASIPVLPGDPASLPVQNAPVVITPATLPDALTGSAYSQPLSAAPGTAPFTFGVTTGSLPTGITLSTAGLVSGTPSAAGTYNFTVGVSDAYGCVGSRAYSVTITCPSMAISPATLPNGLTGYAYSQALSSPGANASHTFTVTLGSLPAGLTLSTAGLLSGTPTTVGSYGFTIRSADVYGCSASQAYSVQVSCPPIVVTPPSLLAGTTGVPYSRTLTAPAAVGPNTWFMDSGSLPAGLLFDTGTGEISGTPLAAGNSSFSVIVTDAYGCSAGRSYLLSIFDGPITNAIAANAAGLCLSTGHPTVTLPFELTRTDAAPALAVSVSFQLQAGRLALATPGDPTSSIHPGTWFTGFPGPIVQVTDNGGGAYTVDLAVAGLPCGPTTGGQLFTADVVSTGPDGPASIAVSGSLLRDCSNDPVGVLPGPDASLTVNTSAPPAIGDLVATPVVSGNGEGGTTAIRLTWSGAVGTVRLYRAPFGTYPEYDDGGGTAPDSLAAPGAPWVLLSGTATSPYVDAGAPRGFWYYVAFVSNECDNVSPVSNRTPGTLDYVLGDVSDGVTRGAGNNTVGLEDITLLGANYGIGEADITSRGIEYLDVGPTTDLSIHARPATDDLIDFEDLMVFSATFGLSATSPPAAPVAARAAHPAAGPEAFKLEAPSLVRPGGEAIATLLLHGEGRVQGFSARLAWDPTVVQPVAVRSGGAVEAQGGVVLSPGPGRVDAALLGAHDRGLEGDLEVARVAFRVLRAGDPAFRLDDVLARDAANRPVATDALQRSSVIAPPAETALLAPGPNPFRTGTALVYALAQAGPASLAIYSVDGRRVRTLVSGWHAAGVFHESWDGRDEARGAVAPGVYYVRLSATGRQFTTRLVCLR